MSLASFSAMLVLAGLVRIYEVVLAEDRQLHEDEERDADEAREAALLEQKEMYRRYGRKYPGREML